MKKNRLILLITILLALTAFLFIYTETKSTLSKSLSNFAIQDTSLVTKVFLTDKSNNKVTLVKKAIGDWSVNNKFTANNDLINIFLKTIARIEVKEPVAKAARNNVIKRLASDATKVEIYQTVYRIDLWGMKLFPHEKLVKTYYVGYATQDNLGTYMLLEDSDEPFIMQIPGFRGFLNTRYSTIENDWRDHSIYKLEIPNIKSVKLEFPATPDNSFLIETAGNNRFTLKALNFNENIADYDTLKLLNYLSAFRDIKFEFLISDKKTHNVDSIIATAPFHIITVTDMSGKKTILKTFHKEANKNEEDAELYGAPSIYDKDRLYAWFNEDKDFALVQFYVFDNILRPLPYFIKPSIKKDKK